VEEQLRAASKTRKPRAPASEQSVRAQLSIRAHLRGAAAASHCAAVARQKEPLCIGKLSLYRYRRSRAAAGRAPAHVYALVNRPYMMDRKRPFAIRASCRRPGRVSHRLGYPMADRSPLLPITFDDYLVARDYILNSTG